MLSQQHQEALQRTALFLSPTRDPWWVLGSAAMALIGVDPGKIRDIDVLVSSRDAQALMTQHDLPNLADGGTAQFRSDYFLLPELGVIPVEVMGGYQIYQAGKWTQVSPVSRRRVKLGTTIVFTPDRDEQVAILQRLGRPKDLDRLKRFS